MGLEYHITEQPKQVFEPPPFVMPQEFLNISNTEDAVFRMRNELYENDAIGEFYKQAQKDDEARELIRKGIGSVDGAPKNLSDEQLDTFISGMAAAGETAKAEKSAAGLSKIMDVKPDMKRIFEDEDEEKKKALQSSAQETSTKKGFFTRAYDAYKTAKGPKAEYGGVGRYNTGCKVSDQLLNLTEISGHGWPMMLGALVAYRTARLAYKTGKQFLDNREAEKVAVEAKDLLMKDDTFMEFCKTAQHDPESKQIIRDEMTKRGVDGKKATDEDINLMLRGIADAGLTAKHEKEVAASASARIVEEKAATVGEINAEPKEPAAATADVSSIPIKPVTKAMLKRELSQSAELSKAIPVSKAIH